MVKYILFICKIQDVTHDIIIMARYSVNVFLFYRFFKGLYVYARWHVVDTQFNRLGLFCKYVHTMKCYILI